ncbi:phage portal protein family protein [Pseudomonas aeruginosa]
MSPRPAQLTSLAMRSLVTHLRGLTPSRLASLLDSAEQGDIVAQYELFEDMEEKDGHIHAEECPSGAARWLSWTGHRSTRQRNS